jgi:hypothetical protein
VSGLGEKDIEQAGIIGGGEGHQRVAVASWQSFVLVTVLLL